ncbi:MAG: NAD(+) synthase [Aeromicrobium sp.]
MTDIQDLSRRIDLEDVGATTDLLVASIRDTARHFRRTGAIVALSGGIDSSACLGLAVRALGAKRVVALTLPDKESSGETVGYAQEVADAFGVELLQRDITAPLDALGCYDDRLAVVQRIVPEFDADAGDRYSVEFDPALGHDEQLQSFRLNVIRGGEQTMHRLGGRDFLTIMAATNQKQRIRMLSTYRIADERNQIVVGTSNRLELDQGFYVKHGDGCGEVFPLRHLLKSHVYEVAAHIGVPESVQKRPPTTDTFSAPQSQEEYFYGTSVRTNDELWLAWDQKEDPAVTAERLGLHTTDVEKFFELYTRRALYAEYLLTSL